MGTITIKNLSSLKDREAGQLAMSFWNGNLSEDRLSKQIIRIIKKGHRFTVVDKQEVNNDRKRKNAEIL